jgi:hypothetical protein
MSCALDSFDDDVVNLLGLVAGDTIATSTMTSTVVELPDLDRCSLHCTRGLYKFVDCLSHRLQTSIGYDAKLTAEQVQNIQQKWLETCKFVFKRFEDNDHLFVRHVQFNSQNTQKNMDTFVGYLRKYYIRVRKSFLQLFTKKSYLSKKFDVLIFAKTISKIYDYKEPVVKFNQFVSDRLSNEAVDDEDVLPVLPVLPTLPKGKQQVFHHSLIN